MEILSPCSSRMATLEDKITKKVHMQKDDLGVDEHLMVVDEDESPNGIDRHFNSRVSFKDMLLGASRATERVLHEQNNDDLQLLDGDVTTGTEDKRLFHGEVLYGNGLCSGSHRRTVVVFGQYLTFQPWGRFVRMAILLDLNKPLVSRIKVDGRLQCVAYESLPNICVSCGRYGHLRDSCSCVSAHERHNEELAVQMVDRGNLEAPIMMLRYSDSGMDFRAIVIESGLEVRWATKETSLADSSLIVGPQDQQAQEFVEKIGATTLNSKCHSVINFVENRNPNILMGNLIFIDSSPKQVEHTIGSASLKVRAYDREPVAEVIIKVVDRIASKSLIMDSSCLQEALAVSNEAINLDAQGCAPPKFVWIVRDYFADFEVDVVAFLETRVSDSKADEIISRIGLGCSHRINAQGFAGGLWTC
ncbi:hypothetical protein Goklo_004076 [Gossypium klotzschianum]|uniref:CCHC-type domain-containing protein n=1 Tax=Gossypium klotzschianum TaxID=34286 RepID=A0A7J8VN48_9ROSI|nr:hypothetical protein [Gossypium klotzschianum]